MRAEVTDEEETVSLGHHLEREIELQAQLTEARFGAMQKAVDLALATSNAKFDTVNEWRQTYAELVSQCIRRPEHEAMLTKYDEQLRLLMDSRACAEGKASQLSVLITLGISLISLMIGIAAVAVKSWR